MKCIIINLLIFASIKKKIVRMNSNKELVYVPLFAFVRKRSIVYLFLQNTCSIHSQTPPSSCTSFACLPIRICALMQPVPINQSDASILWWVSRALWVSHAASPYQPIRCIHAMMGFSRALWVFLHVPTIISFITD